MAKHKPALFCHPEYEEFEFSCVPSSCFFYDDGTVDNVQIFPSQHNTCKLKFKNKTLGEIQLVSTHYMTWICVVLSNLQNSFNLLVRERSALATIIFTFVSVCQNVCQDVCPSFQNASCPSVLDRLSWYYNTMVPYLGKIILLHGFFDPGLVTSLMTSSNLAFKMAISRPIDFVFDPRVGFSGMADRLDLLLVGPNPIFNTMFVCMCVCL